MVLCPWVDLGTWFYLLVKDSYAMTSLAVQICTSELVRKGETPLGVGSPECVCILGEMTDDHECDDTWCSRF